MDQLSKVNTLREEILAGNLSRRAVLKRAAALGLSAPAIAGLLAACGGDDDDDDTAEETEAPGAGQAEEPTATAAEEEPTEAPSDDEEATEPPAEEATPTEAEAEATEAPAAGGEKGGAGNLRLLWWQAPTILNSHFAQGTKDFDAARVVLEPLAEFDHNGELVPFLAAEVPSLENGMVAEDGTSVTWRLREGVTWQDGEPFTSDDVRFTFEFTTDPEAATTTVGSYEAIESIETPDDYTVVVNFAQPTPGWHRSFVGPNGHILPRHLLEDQMGTAARDSDFNLSPVGTGPYMVTEFRPGDVVLFEINPNYWGEGLPHFDSVEMKGGGDAPSAARAAMLTGDADYSWNLQVEADLLNQMEEQGDGVLLIIPGIGVERILVNMTNPEPAEDGERSKLGNPHPFLSDLNVRQALALTPDRDTIANQLYGPTGEATSNWLVAPPAFASPNTSYEYDPERAAQMLDEAGWTVQDGVRQQDGVEMSILYQTSVNSTRQKTQEIVKETLEGIGIPVEIKAIEASVFFDSSPGNPDTWAHFYADWEMYTNTPSSPFPISYAEEHLSADPDVDIPQESNGWSGDNASRWVNEEYNQAYQEATTELDPDRQAELFITMNDLVVNEVAHIPLVHRASVSAHRPDLEVPQQSPWTSELFNLRSWNRTS